MTREYPKKNVLVSKLWVADVEIEQRVQVRIARQTLLTRVTNPPQVWFKVFPMTAAAHLPERHRSSTADSDVGGLESTPEWAGDAATAERFGSPEEIQAALLPEQVDKFDAALTATRQTLHRDQLGLWPFPSPSQDCFLMAYALDVDPAARAQIRELPPAGTTALAKAFEVSSLVPERGKPINADNPEVRSAMRSHSGISRRSRGLWSNLLSPPLP